jgi:hypothetical protein
MKLTKEQLPKYVKSPKWYRFILKLFKSNFRGTTLYPFGIYVKKLDYPDMDSFINHENIHWGQQKEMLVIPFYLWYVIEWVVNIFKFGKRAYIKLSFEQEAYFNQKNLQYLKTRKFYAWTKYLKYKPVK